MNEKLVKLTGLAQLFFLLLNPLAYPLYAQPDPSPGRVLRYSMKEGLSLGVVNSITQDNEGLMWFATGDGLNRFDGTTFTVFKHQAEDPHSLSGNFVKAIFKDRNGTLWASARNGLNEFVPASQQFNRYQPTPPGRSSDVTDISQGRHNNLWLTVNGAGFASFDLTSHRFTYFSKANSPGLTTNSILTVYEDSRGWLWLGTRDSGINVLQKNRAGRWTQAPVDLADLPKTRIHAVYEDHARNVWIASAKGLFFYKRAENRFYGLHLPTFYRSDIYLSLLEDHRGHLLVGVQDGGLYRFNLKQVQSRPPADFSFEPVKHLDNQGITQRSVQALFRDRDQNIWLGTYGEGVYLISSLPEYFRKFEKRTADTRAEGFQRFYGLCVDKDGFLWLGTDGDGIYKSKPTGELVRHYAVDGKPGSLTDGAILAAYRDSGNQLWFGTYSKGLFRYDPATDTFRRFGHDPANPASLGKNDVRVIFEDSRKTLWIGTNGGGLSRLNRQTGTFTNFVPSNSSINSNDVRAIVEDRRGNLWIGTYGGGLNYLDTKTMRFTSFFNQPQRTPYLSNHIVFSLHLDSLDRLFVGSEGNGLLVYDLRTKTTRLFTDQNGLANNVINAIQADETGKIWVSTNAGLSRINLATGRIDNFDRSNGLQEGQFNPGSALFNRQAGFMVFGGTGGWNLFYPKTVKPSDYQPRVMITGLRVFGRNGNGTAPNEDQKPVSDPIQPETHLVLEPSEPVFSIHYTALNYAYPERNGFAYKLEGLDKDWTYVGNEHVATYRYLPAGNYTFKVKAANHDGVWFDAYASVPVTILPPWYQTWWAYLLYAISGVSLFSFYQRYKLDQQRLKYDIELARMERQKDKELNEKKLSFFTNIAHEFRSPLTLIINPVQELLAAQPNKTDETNLNSIYRNAKRLLSLVDQLLLFRKAEQQTERLKPVSLNLPELAREVYHCFLHQAEQKHIRYEFRCESEDLKIPGDWEQIEIALFNLIANALKFTPEHGTVLVSIQEDGERVRITVSDTGPGIPEQVGDRIFAVFHQYKDDRFFSKGGFGIGLHLAKTFVENHFGTLTFESRLNEGTVFTMRLWKQHPELVPQAELGDKPTSVLLEELSGGTALPAPNPKAPQGRDMLDQLNAETHSLLLVDDDPEIRQYLRLLFAGQYKLFEAGDGREGLELVRKHQPDLVISDLLMTEMTGLDLCRQIKTDASLSHIPVVLLTASTSPENRLQGIEGGADDYISKPFDKELLVARVAALLKNRQDLQKYFYNEITLQANDLKISPEYTEFLRECIRIVENHLTDPAFSIKVLAAEIGMSHSTLYSRIKSISGQSMNSFIRFIRLRKAAQLLITTDNTIVETAYQVGINDSRYFREQFQKLFGMKPSEYVKKYRKPFHQNSTAHTDLFLSKTA
ncbi:two-component regulator propeller domain-containing protein [Larkinella sp. VNQ87]|uniref:two-component regulator propeller domain-containing protein n=1 Tax=Larkinella sp. VNQ87 TaxID=3400921 RepID=UPI003C1083D3